ncbi:PLP-dependent transferase [Gloeophyllum trabeum ATCC 11539]|uniref:PLP-dependent transferase n=1 Tax=Gloeophyllum trabeum (strain ATCC 11539 / FP-39264 / Madison 617) TaxID=670483 RepID=S7RT56_GLOTA|nr:PLP-dependent transferase [Gloeophyllum trabeum ATCC 11539]EPQ56294.1 PLP-dependent transferase [Gloeophyllum trabeum ATCC 11539]
MSPTLDVAAARAQFPSLASGFVFAENAGGSQVLGACVERISDYLLHTNVQHGAGYARSLQATARVNEGKRAVAELFGAEGNGEDYVVLGPSSTQLLENLARALEKDVRPGEEIIITGEHETNATPWKHLAARTSASLRLWPHTPAPASSANSNPYAVALQLDALLPLITPNTRLVALSACSNLLGSAVDVKAVVDAVKARAQELRARKVEVCVDCVAYAPHRRMEVSKWGVEYAVCSLYKVYGPHISALYAAPSALPALSSLAHHFLPTTTSPIYKIQPGGPGYELAYACTAVPAYLRALSPSRTLAESFALIQAHEAGLVRRLVGWLEAEAQGRRGVRLVGEGVGAGERRVPTVSFVVQGRRSQDVVGVFDETGTVGIRYGHCYAYGLVERLEPKIDIDDAVVRVSLVHYNTLEEVEKIIEVLDKALDG